MLTSSWYSMTTIMPICFVSFVLFIIVQAKSLKWYTKQMHDDGIYKKRVELFCLYGLYSFGALCAIQCFMCHVSYLFPDWYCIYGMSVCTILYSAAKTCLYGFFLERAKCVEMAGQLFPPFVTKYVLPAWIACYFVVYLILCPLTFRGIVVEDHVEMITACIFGEYQQWVFVLSAAVDVVNAALFLALFCYPLYDAIKRRENFEDSDAHRQLRKELIIVVKWNVVCSSICSVSSVTFLVLLTFAKTGHIGHYMWLAGNIDAMTNSLCVFLMVSANRKYIGHLCAKHEHIMGCLARCFCRDGAPPQQQTSVSIDTTSSSKAAKSTARTKTNDEIEIVYGPSAPPVCSKQHSGSVEAPTLSLHGNHSLSSGSAEADMTIIDVQMQITGAGGNR